MNKVDLKIDWCSHEAAKYAVMKWHYSKTMPCGSLNRIGVWENGGFIGALLFGRGSSIPLKSRMNLNNFTAVELLRVALDTHITPVSKILSIALRIVKNHNPKLRVVFSYADINHNHHGGIYQASNWIYIGTGGETRVYLDSNGKQIHTRVVSKTGVKRQFGILKRCYKSSDLRAIKIAPKHCYLFCYDDDLKSEVIKLAKPYPKSAGSIQSNALADQAREGGAIPTSALNTNRAANE